MNNATLTGRQIAFQVSDVCLRDWFGGLTLENGADHQQETKDDEWDADKGANNSDSQDHTAYHQHKPYYRTHQAAGEGNDADHEAPDQPEGVKVPMDFFLLFCHVLLLSIIHTDGNIFRI